MGLITAKMGSEKGASGISLLLGGGKIADRPPSADNPCTLR